MASKTYEGRQAPPENNAKSCKAGTDAGARSVLICGNGDCGGGDDDSDADHEEEAVLKVESVDGEKKKKKRKRSKKKKTAVKGGLVQSSPPRVPVSELFPSGIYPRGETLAYTDDKTARTSGEEIRYLERFDYKFLEDYRQAAEVHRQVRQWTQQSVKPGQTLTEIAEGVEDSVRALLGNQGLGPGDGLKAGMGFPTGLCLNNCGAHFTPNPGAKEIILQKEDVMKIDFGVHINGRIVDSAFTVAFDPVYDNLLAAVKDATNTGVRVAGIDARMGEIGSSIQEVMESYEVEIKGKVFPVKAIRNIAGHNIKPYQIHGGKSVPFVKSSDDTKMEAGEVFAIETFGSTGRGYLRDDVGTYGYGKNFNTPKVNLRLSSAKSLLKTIDQNFGTLVFARRYLERLGINHYLAGMNELVSTGIVEEYAPLVDVKGSYVAQFEHTILLHDSGKEVISRGEDY